MQRCRGKIHRCILLFFGGGKRSVIDWNLFHFLLKKYCIKAPINNPTEEITKYQMECMSAESL